VNPSGRIVRTFGQRIGLGLVVNIFSGGSELPGASLAR
jgi:hypothetical protein